MKVCIQITSQGNTNPIAMALKAITRANPTLQLVEMPEKAELVVVNDIATAAELLKDDEDVKVLVAVAPGSSGSSAKAGALALAKRYPGRVFARPMLELEGEQNIAVFLVNLNKEEVK